MHTITSATMTSLLLVFLLLPLLATAEGPVWRPPVWPPVVQQPYYWSDALNITRCYCLGVHDDDHRPGHYLQIDYRNFHNGITYTLPMTCDSDATRMLDIDPEHVEPVPECWNSHPSWRQETRTECVEGVTFADTLCFELGNHWDDGDYYIFDGQWRQVPESGFVEYEADQCVELCRDKVGGKVVPSEYILQRAPLLFFPPRLMAILSP